MISVQKYAIKGSMIKDIDLFRLKDHYMSIFISESLRKLWRRMELLDAIIWRLKLCKGRQEYKGTVD